MSMGAPWVWIGVGVATSTTGATVLLHVDSPDTILFWMVTVLSTLGGALTLLGAIGAGIVMGLKHYDKVAGQTLRGERDASVVSGNDR